MTTMNEVNRDKTKVPDHFFFFRNVSLVCFTVSLLLKLYGSTSPSLFFFRKETSEIYPYRGRSLHKI